MAVAGAPPAAELVQAAQRLGSSVSGAADQIERERRLPAPLVDALIDAGLFRMLVPAALGGSETDPLTFGLVIEEIARADGSTAWCLAQAAGSGVVAVAMDQRSARELFADRRIVIAWGPGLGTAAVLDDGYRLTGRWPFASGCHHANWLGASAKLLNPDGSQRLQDSGLPELRRMLFPASSAQITDVWSVSGLRGTGSDTYAVEDLFVPAGYSVPCAPSGIPLLEPRWDSGPLYAFPLALVYGIGFASVALGIARGALDAFVDLAGAKTLRGTTGVLRDDAVIQSQVALAEAGVRSSRAFLHDAVREAWDSASAGVPLAPAQHALIRLAATYTIHEAARAVDTIYHAAGATAIFTSNPFERRFRDVHAVTQQGQGSQTHFKTVGQFFLGFEANPAAL